MKNFIVLFVLLFSVISCNKEEYEPFSKEIPLLEIAFPTDDKESVLLESGYIIDKKDSLNIFQGDMLLTDEQVELLSKTETRSCLMIDTKYRWPNGKVYYTFKSDISSKTKLQILEAIAVWSSSSDIEFIQRTNEKDYIEFFNGNGNYSYVGRIGGKQQISIDLYGGNKGSAIHEIGHALGLFHEHCRPDRDIFIEVHYDNILPEKRSNFNIVSQRVLMGDMVSLDYESIMLYSSYNSFAIDVNKPTMTRKSDGATWTAQRSYLSFHDKAIIIGMYPPTNPFLPYK